jgi:chloramphenicol 3-O-phosphotransferase
MCLLGRSFYEAGFTVVLDDIIIGERWRELQDDLRGLPVTLVVLAPSPEVVTRVRDTRRAKAPQGAAWAAYLDRELRATLAEIGVWVDSSHQTPEETVAAILAGL